MVLPSRPAWAAGPGKAAPAPPNTGYAALPGGYAMARRSASAGPGHQAPPPPPPSRPQAAADPIRVTAAGRGVLEQLRLASAFEDELEGCFAQRRRPTVSSAAAVAPAGAAFVSDPEEERKAWCDVLLDEPLDAFGPANHGPRAPLGPLSMPEDPQQTQSFFSAAGRAESGSSVAEHQRYGCVGGYGEAAENIRPWSQQVCRPQHSGEAAIATQKRSSTAEPAPGGRRHHGRRAAPPTASGIVEDGSSSWKMTQPAREGSTMKMQQLHEQRELSWRREQEERERRIRQNRAKAHAELTDKCLVLEENQAHLCRLTDNVLRPVMRSRLKGLEKRHRRRQEGFCRHQDEFERYTRGFPPRVPLLPGEGMTMRIPEPGSSVFERGLAGRKMQEVVGSPGAPLRSKQHLGNLAALLLSDLDAAQGEETAKSTVLRPVVDMKGRKFDSVH